MIDLKVLFISGLLIEVITIIARFMFKQSSKKTYISLMMGKRLKYFIHLHHGITGIIICAVTYILGQSLLFNIGLGMIFSDLAHHVLVLWPLTGSPEFHLIYKNPLYYKKQRAHPLVHHLIHHVALPKK